MAVTDLTCAHPPSPAPFPLFSFNPLPLPPSFVARSSLAVRSVPPASSLALSLMPPTRTTFRLPYDGTSRKTSKKKTNAKAPALTAEEKQRRREQRKERQLALYEGTEKIRQDREAAVNALAESTGQSAHHVNVLVGTKTTLIKPRRANAYNAWASITMSERNAGEFVLTSMPSTSP